VRWVVLFFALVASAAVVAQDVPKKKKKPATKQAKQVRGKPTPEQIRKFNELQKKQQP
jgi:hypothetical protein